MAQSLFEELIAIDPYKDIDQTEYVDPKGETGIQDYLLDIIRAPVGGISDAIQGLIQLAVAFFHITNLNLKGSKNLFEKCLPKLQQFSSSHRDLNLDEIIIAAESSYREVMLISHSKKFNWNLAPKIIRTI